MSKVRKSLLSLITATLLVIIPISTASAHSVLENSSPADGDQLEETIKSIELDFNTKVENGSTLYLVNNAGKEIQPANVEITDDVLIATFEDSLEPGSYQVNWQIVGADGHPIENQYSFTIKESETKQAEDDPNQSENNQTNGSKTDNNSKKNGEETETDQKNQEAEQKNASEQETSNDNEQSSLGNGIIILLIIAGLVLLIWMLFSKRKK